MSYPSSSSSSSTTSDEFDFIFDLDLSQTIYHVLRIDFVNHLVSYCKAGHLEDSQELDLTRLLSFSNHHDQQLIIAMYQWLDTHGYLPFFWQSAMQGQTKAFAFLAQLASNRFSNLVRLTVDQGRYEIAGFLDQQTFLSPSLNCVFKAHLHLKAVPLSYCKKLNPKNACYLVPNNIYSPDLSVEALRNFYLAVLSKRYCNYIDLRSLASIELGLYGIYDAKVFLLIPFDMFQPKRPDEDKADYNRRLSDLIACLQNFWNLSLTHAAGQHYSDLIPSARRDSSRRSFVYVSQSYVLSGIFKEFSRLIATLYGHKRCFLFCSLKGQKDLHVSPPFNLEKAFLFYDHIAVTLSCQGHIVTLTSDDNSLRTFKSMLFSLRRDSDIASGANSWVNYYQLGILRGLACSGLTSVTTSSCEEHYSGLISDIKVYNTMVHDWRRCESFDEIFKCLIRFFLSNDRQQQIDNKKQFAQFMRWLKDDWTPALENPSTTRGNRWETGMLHVFPSSSSWQADYHRCLDFSKQYLLSLSSFLPNATAVRRIQQTLFPIGERIQAFFDLAQLNFPLIDVHPASLNPQQIEAAAILSLWLRTSFDGQIKRLSVLHSKTMNIVEHRSVSREDKDYFWDNKECTFKHLHPLTLPSTNELAWVGTSTSLTVRGLNILDHLLFQKHRPPQPDSDGESEEDDEEEVAFRLRSFTSFFNFSKAERRLFNAYDFALKNLFSISGGSDLWQLKTGISGACQLLHNFMSANYERVIHEPLCHYPLGEKKQVLLNLFNIFLGIRSDRRNIVFLAAQRATSDAINLQYFAIWRLLHSLVYQAQEKIEIAVDEYLSLQPMNRLLIYRSDSHFFPFVSFDGLRQNDVSSDLPLSATEQLRATLHRSWPLVIKSSYLKNGRFIQQLLLECLACKNQDEAIFRSTLKPLLALIVQIFLLTGTPYPQLEQRVHEEYLQDFVSGFDQVPPAAGIANLQSASIEWILKAAAVSQQVALETEAGQNRQTISDLNYHMVGRNAIFIWCFNQSFCRCALISLIVYKFDGSALNDLLQIPMIIVSRDEKLRWLDAITIPGWNQQGGTIQIPHWLSNVTPRVWESTAQRQLPKSERISPNCLFECLQG